MTFSVDEEILQDFLIEAGEILELLQEQLVDLENNPDDSDLLNAIFRGFHTVKGGAGFLSLTPMVDVCHEAENTFDLLRTGQRHVTAELMDIILQSVDAINSMFSQTQAGEQQEPAEPELLRNLKMLSSGEALPNEQAASESDAAGTEVEAEPDVIVEVTSEEADQQSKSDSIDEITDSEFEDLLDALHGQGKGATNAKISPTIEAETHGNDDISDDEFEALLDELHGSGGFNCDVIDTEKSVDNTGSAIDERTDEITDDEFENLLNELHGSSAPGVSLSSNQSTQKSNEKLVSESKAQRIKPEVKSKGSVEAVKAAKKDVPASNRAISAPQGETTVRVDTARLDQIMNMVGELVLVRNRLVSLGVNRDDEEMSKALANLDLVTADLQGAVMKTRMQPIKKVFGRFPRVVRDLARTLNKDINLVMIGEDTDLDKNLVEALADPLVHLVRNSVDHGIEMPDEREANNKSRTGTITLSASQEGDHILLKIEDDGAGMDPEKLKNIAIERGVLDEDSASRMTDNEAYNLIFAPGFSTKAEISDISGRGVGMDVVKTRITQLNGTVYIDSSRGEGTVLEIKVPLTLAIMPTLMVDVAKQIFALPLTNVSEIFHLDLTKTNIVDGQLTVIVRGKAVPLFYLEQWLHQTSALIHGDKQHGHVVIVQLGTMQIGFVVDALIGQEEVVIKPLGTLLHGTPGMAGATITSDGGIALILDVPGLLKHYANNK
ncbi:chemotaxis protein CheA [Parashewanella spongiae]|uniref:Chemotaxis protein CheA n=1 Tax=Parashewanella spongiae TaxID=342950 RepID=A0A3A6TYR2_9GAMM|nr:chemotaxis protein CheA [Parashewanella spongiae]MCL1077663.1 chemotaxis protein CheA [Parashewanella spongiae]RJY18251.1 chemotaxis protein CheA [Parashewanella spongiae]